MLLDNRNIHRLISAFLKGLLIMHLRVVKQEKSVTMTVQDI